MLNTEKTSYVVVGFILSVVMVMSVLSKFSFLLPIQIVIFLMLLLVTLFLVNKYSFKINSYISISLVFILFCCISYINADFKVNVRDYIIVVSSALLAGFNFSFLSVELKKKLFIVPVFIALWLSMILFTRFITNPNGFLFGDDFYDTMALNINVISGFLVLVFPLFFIPIKEKQNHKILITMMIFVLFAIFLTRSRISILISFILTIIFLFEYRKNKYIKYLIYLLSILLIGSIIYISTLKFNFNSISERIIWWKTALLMFKENIFFGCGLGNYTVLFKAFRPELVLNTLFAHNIFVQLLAEIGIFGTVSFIAIIIYFYINIVKRILENKNVYFYISVALSVSAFLIINLVDYSFFVPANMLMFFIIFSCAFSFDFSKLNKTKINTYFLILCYVIFAVFIAKPIVAQVYYDKGIEFVVANQYKMAIEEFEKAVKFDSKNPEYYAQLSKSYFAIYDKIRNDEGLHYAEKAIEYNKKAIYLYKNGAQLKSSLAFIYWNIGKNEEALKTMQEAIKYDKYNPYYEQYYYQIKNS